MKNGAGTHTASAFTSAIYWKGGVFALKISDQLPYPFISIELIHEQAQHRMEAESYAAPTYIDSSSLPFQLVLLSLITRPI